MRYTIILILFSMVLVSILLALGTVQAGTKGSDPLETPLDLDFTLPVPQEKTQRDYLGLAPGKVFTPGQTFTLDQVQTDILIIEIFSMYCPICQREASNVNKLFQMIQATESYKKRIRLMGIGAGNSAYEVDFFKENYNIEFPLFSDGKFLIHKKVGEKGTPFFIGLHPGEPKGSQVFFTHSGEIKDLDEFLNQLMKTSHE